MTEYEYIETTNKLPENVRLLLHTMSNLRKLDSTRWNIGMDVTEAEGKLVGTIRIVEK